MTRLRLGLASTVALLLLAGARREAAAQDTAASLLQSGDAKYAQKDYEGAAADYERAIELDASSLLAWNGRGNARSALKDYDGAIADYTKAMSLSAGDAVLHWNRGYSLSLKGDLDAAAADFDRSISLNPQYADAYIQRAHLCSRRDDYPGAVAFLTRGIESIPDRGHLYEQRAWAWCGQGDPARAWADADRAVHLDASLQGAWIERAHSSVGLGDYAAALDDYAKAIPLVSGDGTSWYMRGCALYDLGRWAESAEDLLRAKTLGDQAGQASTLACLRRWCSRARLGERDEATRELREYLQGRGKPDPDAGNAAIARFLLGEISETELLDPEEPNPGSRPARTSMCGRCFYAGTVRLLDGDARGARALFRRGLETGMANALVYTAMKAELEAGPGIYDLEEDIDFNCLTGAAFDPATGAVTLVGTRDARFHGPAIPYLRHLATLLEHPEPKFSLRWTPESEAAVDALLARFDSMDEVRQMGADWGKVLDENGLATTAGRHLLPLWGVKPTDNGAGPGQIGASVEVNDRAQLRVTEVSPGSAADRAGLRTGDILMTLNNKQPFHPEEFRRFIRFTGAGATLAIMAQRPGEGTVHLTATLDACEEDRWSHVDRYDIVERMLHATGKTPAAWVVNAMGVWHRVKGSDQAVTNRAIQNIVGACGGFEFLFETMEKVRQGEISEAEATQRCCRAVAEGMDRHFELAGAPVTGAYEQALSQGQAPDSAIDVAIQEMNGQLYGVLDRAMNALRAGRDEIEISPEMMRESLGATPVVVPEYDGVDPGTPLADVMLRADYISKNLFHLPSLRERIPAYQTEFAFDRAHPEAGGGEGAVSAHHIWISVERLDLARSPDGRTLEIRDARMRFNIREKAPGGGDQPAESGGYDALLTSIYDDLAVEFPVYHELRECAKLAAVAPWLKTCRPDLRLPAPKDPPRKPPASLPGTVYMTMSLHPLPGSVSASIMAVGGVSLVPPVPPEREVGPAPILRAIPEDASVVPLTGTDLVVEPEVYRNEALARVLRRKIEVPVPRPVGWVTTATKGERTVKALTVLSVAEGTDPEESIRVGRKLEAARENALRLAEVERAINAITSQSPTRQAELRQVEERLAADREKFIAGAVSILTQRLCDAHDLVRQKDLSRGPLEAMSGVADGMRETKSALDALKEKLAKIEQGLKIAGGSREEAIGALGELAKELVEKGDPRALSPLGRVLFPIRRTLAAQEKVKDVAGLATSLAGLAAASREMAGAEKRTDAELTALKDKLLPLQRQLSDRQDRLMRDPDLKRLGGN